MAALGMVASAGISIGCGGGGGSDSDGGGSSNASISFKSIPGSLTDAVTIADGYTADILAPWGTPINSVANEWKDDGTNTADDQENSIGMHHDGIYYFPINGSNSDGLLAINHEYIDSDALHSVDPDDTDPDQVRKEIAAHGVSVVRVKVIDGRWEVVKDDPLNRRYTGASVMDLAGPVAGTANTVTPFSNDGTQTRGTLNNCGSGVTPWGTFITCEENWPGYFVIDETVESTADARIGISSLTSGWYNWHNPAGDASEVADEFTRFNLTPSTDAGASSLTDYRNEANGYGYNVEIDPYDASANPVKRTAMGRFRHECCVYGKLTEGQPTVWYSGHDGRFEYLYKFVSNANWDPADADRSDRLAVGSKYLDGGTLYVARFDEGGNGVWLPLTLTGAVTAGGTLGDTYTSLDEIILDTASAADAVGATPMDRPEWIAVDPLTGSVYLTLTNNTKRTEANAANPRINNSFGHVIRWDEDEGSQTTFSWDIFVYGSPDDGDAATNLSGLTADNQFASPDGLVFDSRGIMWIQTDNGADEVEEETNDQILACVPSQLLDDDGNPATITADNQAELKRFLVGPNGCEVTGMAFTPDNKVAFINIQHPGNWPYSNDATEVTVGDVRPRAATVVIRKADGGTLG